MRESTAFLLLVMLLIGLCNVESRATIYKLNDNDKLEPVLVAVSSTVIPLPVYKVSTGVEVVSKKGKPSEPVKLITVDKKYTGLKPDDSSAINIRQISKEEFEAQA